MSSRDQSEPYPVYKAAGPFSTALQRLRMEESRLACAAEVAYVASQLGIERVCDHAFFSGPRIAERFVHNHSAGESYLLKEHAVLDELRETPVATLSEVVLDALQEKAKSDLEAALRSGVLRIPHQVRTIYTPPDFDSSAVMRFLFEENASAFGAYLADKVQEISFWLPHLSDKKRNAGNFLMQYIGEGEPSLMITDHCVSDPNHPLYFIIGVPNSLPKSSLRIDGSGPKLDPEFLPRPRGCVGGLPAAYFGQRSSPITQF